MKNKKDLFNKLSSLEIKDIEKIGLEKSEIEYIKTKLLNDKIGLKLNYKEYDLQLEKNYMILKEIPELGINVKHDQPNNLLIEGDNYYALKALQAAGTKVDIIYIDPPYNTGKEFIYNDDFSNDPKPVTADEPHKHSKWLSFMKRRLELAREVLSDEGVVFVSIDDAEQAYLKVLMDDIFGEEKFVANMPRSIASGGKNNGSTIAKEHEYILLYGNVKRFNGIKSNVDNFKLNDNDGMGNYQLRDLVAAPGAFERTGSQTLPFSFNGVEYKPTKSNGASWYWRWGSERMELGKKLNLIVEKNGKLFSKLYVDWDFKQGDNQLVSKSRTQLMSSRNFIDSKYINGKGSKDIKELSLNFSFPKPVNLVKDLINLYINNNAIVFDFFAGSGTTGQAVMELNEEDGGNRRFILVTNNEMKGVDTILEPNKGISRSVTRERIFRVVNGKGSKDERIEWEFSKDKKSLLNNSMAYLKVETIHKSKGEFESIDNVKSLFKREFNKEIDIIDLRMQEKNE